MWRPDQLPIVLVEAGAEALHRRAGELDAEQAVHGLDALPEVGFHPLLAAAFRGAGLGVWQEFPFPGEPGRRPRHSERERCDLVITKSPDAAIRDPVQALREELASAGTLFEGHDRIDAACGVAPADAFWLEVKLIGQFCYSHGVPGPNRTYAAELLRTAPADIPKLVRDPGIRFAGLQLVLFTADAKVAEHDLGVVMDRCLRKGLPVSAPEMASFPVGDRIGNGVCTLALIPVRGGATP
jgi:hypothetical protein